jgi:hypothetical protein
MAFGAFTGRGSGLLGQKPYGLSQMFAGLSEGLADFAKLKQGSDLEESRLKHDDARTAADHAFQDNLARFHVKAQEEHDVRVEGAADEREKTRAGVESQHWNDMKSHQEAQDKIAADREKREGAYQSESLNIQRENKKNLEEDRNAQKELRKQQTDAAAAAMVRGDAAAADKIATDMVATPKQNMYKAQTGFDAIVKAGIDPSSQQYKDAQLELNTAKSNLESAERDAAPIRKKALDAIGYGDKPSAPADPLASLPPDRQEWAKRQMAANPSLTPEKAAEKAKDPALTQALIDKVISQPAPTTKPPQAFAGDTGMANVGEMQTQPETGQTAVVSGGPSQYTTQGPEMTGPPAPDAAAAPPPSSDNTTAAAAAPPAQAAPAAPDPAAQFEGMAQSINNTPEGQGIVTTLSRLAESKEGPVADKMRRAAEIQLQEQYPDQDANGFIDYFLNQNAQEVA